MQGHDRNGAGTGTSASRLVLGSASRLVPQVLAFSFQHWGGGRGSAWGRALRGFLAASEWTVGATMDAGASMDAVERAAPAPEALTRAKALSNSILAFSGELSGSLHFASGLAAGGDLAALREAMATLRCVIDSALEQSRLLMLPTELQLRVLSLCSARSLCRLVATARCFRSLVERAEPLAAQTQFGESAASLRPPTRTPPMRLRWLEEAAMHAKKWKPYGEQPPRILMPPRYEGGDAEAGAYMLAIAHFKASPPETPALDEDADGRSPILAPTSAPAAPPVLLPDHPKAEAVFVSCVRVVLAIIDPPHAFLATPGVAAQRTHALEWLGERLACEELSAANRAFAVEQAEQLVRLRGENQRGGILREDHAGTLPQSAVPLLRGLWLASRHLHGNHDAKTVRRGLAYARWLWERDEFARWQSERDEPNGDAKVARIECMRVLREVLHAQRSDSAVWPSPHPFLTACALCNCLCESDVTAAVTLFDQECASIWQARSSCDARSEFSPAELNDFYGYGDGFYGEASIHTRLRSAAKRCVTQIVTKAKQLEEQGKFDLSESVQRRMLQLLERYTEEKHQFDVDDLHFHVDDSEDTAFLFSGSLIACKQRLARMLLSRYESAPKLEEVKSMMQDTTAGLRKSFETLLGKRLADQSDFLARHQIDERDETTLDGSADEEDEPLSYRKMLIKANYRLDEREPSNMAAINLADELCQLIIVMQRLGKQTKVQEITQEVIALYHAIAAGDAITFEELHPSWCEPAMKAQLRKRIAEVVGMGDLCFGAEALQRARIEKQETTFGAKHYHTLHSRGMLGLMLIAHEKAEEGCQALRQTIDGFGTYGSLYDLGDVELKRSMSVSKSLREESACHITRTLERALEDADKYDEARELGIKRDAEMLELTNGLDSRERYATRRATALIRAGRLSEAESVLLEALQAERDALLSKPRSGRYRVCTRACVLSELLSRSDDEAVLSEAEQLAREAGQGTDDSSSERYAIILARVLAKQGKHDEARIVLRQRLSQCKKYNMHELEANLALVLFRHAQALRQELDEEEQEAEYDDTVAQTALRLKWSARSDRLAQAASLMHKMLAQNDRERGTMNPISGLTMSMAHSNCMRVLREIEYEQRRDEDWASPHHCEDGEEGAMDEEPESEAGEKCEEGEQVTTECASVSLAIAMAAAVAHAASGPIASTGNEMDGVAADGRPTKRQRVSDGEQ